MPVVTRSETRKRKERESDVKERVDNPSHVVSKSDCSKEKKPKVSIHGQMKETWEKLLKDTSDCQELTQEQLPLYIEFLDEEYCPSFNCDRLKAIRRTLTPLTNIHEIIKQLRELDNSYFVLGTFCAYLFDMQLDF